MYLHIRILIYRLQEELLECQKLYNSLLKKTLEDQKDKTILLKSMVKQNIAIRCNCCLEYSDFDYEKSPNAKDLIEWLQCINIDKHSIKKVSFKM